jgi:hypothetical protein
MDPSGGSAGSRPAAVTEDEDSHKTSPFRLIETNNPWCDEEEKSATMSSGSSISGISTSRTTAISTPPSNAECFHLEPPPCLTLSYRTNLHLPDIDDVSMNHVFEYVEHYEQDLFWSFLSDSFFILGGVTYVLLALWDAVWPPEGSRNYYTLDVLAPVIYLFNSSVDMGWAIHAKRRVQAKRAMQESWEGWLKATAKRTKKNDDGGEDSPLGLCRWRRVRKHAAHRRTILAALTFGIAALLGVLVVALEYADAAHFASSLDTVSAYVYVVSATLSITGKRVRPWFTWTQYSILNDSETLEDFGDLFFLIGCLMDVLAIILKFEEAYWPLVSSLLWLVDACLYLRSDFVMAGRLRERTEGMLV